MEKLFTDLCVLADEGWELSFSSGFGRCVIIAEWSSRYADGETISIRAGSQKWPITGQMLLDKIAAFKSRNPEMFGIKPEPKPLLMLGSFDGKITHFNTGEWESPPDAAFLTQDW